MHIYSKKEVTKTMYTDKEILCDGLSTQKATTGRFNMSANECANPQLRDTVLKILNQEHSIQFDVFQMMHARGLYPTPPADAQKIKEAAQKFAQQ